MEWHDGLRAPRTVQPEHIRGLGGDEHMSWPWGLAASLHEVEGRETGGAGGFSR